MAFSWFFVFRTKFVPAQILLVLVLITLTCSRGLNCEGRGSQHRAESIQRRLWLPLYSPYLMSEHSTTARCQLAVSRF